MTLIQHLWYQYICNTTTNRGKQKLVENWYLFADCSDMVSFKAATSSDVTNSHIISISSILVHVPTSGKSRLQTCNVIFLSFINQTCNVIFLSYINKTCNVIFLSYINKTCLTLYFFHILTKAFMTKLSTLQDIFRVVFKQCRNLGGEKG